MAANNIGGTLAIAVQSDGTTPDPVTESSIPLAGSDFSALTWEDIPNLGTHGDTGVDQNMTQYDSWDQPLSIQRKGIATGKQSEVRFLDEASNGLTAIKAAATVNDNNNYAFRLTRSTGEIEYNVAVVSGAGYAKGGPEDYPEAYFTLAFNQEPVFA